MTPKQKRFREKAEAGRAMLAAIFPKCFAGKGEKKVPLKIGIFKDIRALRRDIPYRVVKAALHDYTSGALYLKATVAGAARINLDGDAVDVVTAEQAAWAAERLKKNNAAKRRRIRAQGEATKVRRESERTMEMAA